MDYFQASDFDQSDGQSLRRYIDRKSFNEEYDERVAVVELDNRVPTSDGDFEGSVGGIPNFMIRHGNYKLILPRLADSGIMDMFYNLTSDPYEMQNLLGNRADSVSHAVIGKLEHLKILLMAWMRRNDNGAYGYYTNSRYNMNIGNGDMAEIRKRRTWKEVNFWISENEVLPFGPPVLTSRGMYERNEYIYMGRTERCAIIH